MKKESILIAAALLLMPLMASAETENDAVQDAANPDYKMKNLQIEDSPITQKEFYAPVLEDPIVTPKSHRIFTDKADREKIESTGLNILREALPFLSPSFFASTQDKKYRNFLKSRGKSVALQLDGNLMTNGDAAGGGFDNRFSDSVLLEQIESIEVIKDSQTLMYGNTRGSVIHLRSRRPVNENRFSAEIGEYGKQAYTLSIGRDNEKTAYLFNLKTLRYDGPSWHNKYEKNKSLYFKFIHDFNDKDKIEFSYSYSDTAFGVPVAKRTNTTEITDAIWNGQPTRQLVKRKEDAHSFDPWKVQMINLNYDHKWNDNNLTRVQFGKVKSYSIFHNPNGVGPHVDNHFREEDTDSFALRHVWNKNDKIVRAGYTFSHWENPTGKLGNENCPQEDKNHSAYIQTELPIIKDKLTFDAGYRYDRRYVAKQLTQKNYQTPGGARKNIFVEDVWEKPRSNFSTGLTYKANQQNTFAIRAGMFEVAPNDRYATIDGSALKNQKDTDFDFGYEYKTKNEKTTFKANLFKYKYKDKVVADETNGTYKLIDAATDDYQKIYVNSPDTVDYKGGEISVSTEIGKHLEIELGYGKTKSNPFDKTYPEKSYLFSLRSRNYEYWSWNLYGRYVEKYEASTRVNPVPFLPVGDFWDVNFTLSHKIKNTNSKITLAVKNILDKDLETVPFAVDSGRRFSITWENLF